MQIWPDRFLIVAVYKSPITVEIRGVQEVFGFSVSERIAVKQPSVRQVLLDIGPECVSVNFIYPDHV